MLTVSQLSKSFGGRVLFEDASLQVNRGDRIAIIGPNGAGKTTLFSILLGLDEHDKGEVAIQRGVNVGYLPQESASTRDATVLQIGLERKIPKPLKRRANGSRSSGWRRLRCRI